MMSPIDAADQIRQFARQYKAMQDVADTLQRVGSLEQAIAECEKAVTVARARRDADIEAIAGEVATAQVSLQDAKDKAERLLTEARAAAQVITDNAGYEARRIKTQAADEANEIRARAEKASQASKAAEVDARGRLAGVEQAIDNAKRNLADVQAQTAEAEAKLTNARADIARLLGS